MVRRLRYAIAVLSLLLILVVANALLHSDENPLNPIAAAAERTQEQPGARFTMSAVYNSAALQQPMTARGSGADSSLDALRRVDGDAQRLGRETVDGVPTQRYRAQLSYDGYAGLLRDEGKDEIADQMEKFENVITTPPTIEAWVDDEGILRRMRMVMTLPTAPGQPPVTTDMQMNLFDIGARPAIAVPAESRVFDATELVQQQLDAS
jgi:hypothetical protein